MEKSLKSSHKLQNSGLNTAASFCTCPGSSRNRRTRRFARKSPSSLSRESRRLVIVHLRVGKAKMIEHAEYVYVPPVEIELKFLKFCRDKSAEIKWEYEAWLETHYGDCSDDSYCFQCANKQKYVERNKKTGFTSVCRFVESPESDHVKVCARCGCMLHHSLTRYGIENEIEFLSQQSVLDAYTAAIWCNLLDGIGDYKRSKDWPLIEKHAIRLMAAG